MVLVEQIHVMNEDSKHILYFQTEKGFYSQTINNNLADKITGIINNRDNKNSHLISSSSNCTLLKGQIAMVDTNGSQQKNTWEESLPVALESGFPIYVESQLLYNDFCCENQEHQAFVDELIREEQLFDKSMKIKKYIQQLVQAIEDERFEDAALLRDKMESCNFILS